MSKEIPQDKTFPEVNCSVKSTALERLTPSSADRSNAFETPKEIITKKYKTGKDHHEAT